MSELLSPTRVLVVGGNGENLRGLTSALADAGFEVARVGQEENALHTLDDTPPQCLLLFHEGPESLQLLSRIKHDQLYGNIPVLLVLRPESLHAIDWRLNPADDFIVQPPRADVVIARVRLGLARAERDLFANPLTGLPGNVALMRETEARLASGQPFALAYLDIDNFKPFNDKYGFSRGDEVLRMTARLITNAVRTLEHSETYVGHVGGDDFIFIVPGDLVEDACKQIVEAFDLVVPNFYDEDDRMHGHIQSTDRQGNPQIFPLMGCSIAVVDTASTDIHHIADLSARAAEVKKYAKTMPGSTYLIDRRK